jgi:hypothetical protein
MIPQHLREELKKLDKEIFLARLIVIVAMVVLLTAYFGWFGFKVEEGISESSATWGTLGDFFGGLLNPLIASLALYWLTRSVRIQKEELYETRSALQDAATAQASQVELAALTALSNVISAEIELQRNHLYFIVNQLSSFQHSSVRSLEGKAISTNEVESLVRKINEFISTRLGEQREYEARILALLASCQRRTN